MGPLRELWGTASRSPDIKGCWERVRAPSTVEIVTEEQTWKKGSCGP